MAMTSTAVRFAPEERDWIRSYADMKGMTVSAVIRESVLERIEDELDLVAYEDALRNDDGIRYTLRDSAALHGIRL